MMGLLVATPATAQVTAGDLPDRAVDWLQEYIGIDTTNPPGNEIAGARFFARIFEAEGIPSQTRRRGRHPAARRGGHSSDAAP